MIFIYLFIYLSIYLHIYFIVFNNLSLGMLRAVSSILLHNLPSHGYHPAWFRHLVIQLYIKKRITGKRLNLHLN